MFETKRALLLANDCNSKTLNFTELLLTPLPLT